MQPLAGRRVVSIAVNIPGPLCTRRLADLGAHVIKVEPPTGDPLAHFAPRWYAELTRGMEIVVRDLKQHPLDDLLADADLLVTSSRPSSLARLGLGPEAIADHRRLCHVAIVGWPGGGAEIPGHDLNYQGAAGLLSPPQMPPSLFADIAGAERAAFAGLALLADRDRTGIAGTAEVSLAEAATALARPGAMLNTGNPFYTLYETADGWAAVGCLEEQFATRLTAELGPDLAAAFRRRSAEEWAAWARDQDLPITVVAPPAAPAG